MPQAVDHRGMRVRANHRIGESTPGTVLVDVENNSTEIFEVYLMDDAGIRWDHAKVLECALAPT